MVYTIRTNHIPRYTKFRYELPEKILSDDFDWLDNDQDDGFIYYLGTWYHLSQFMRLDGDEFADLGYHGYHGDSYFSGVLIKICNYGESVIMATYYC